MVVSIHRDSQSCNGKEVQDFVVNLESVVSNKRVSHHSVIRGGYMYIARTCWLDHMLLHRVETVKSGTRSLEIDRSDESCLLALMRTGCNLVEILLKHLSWVMDETSVSTREYGYYMLVVLCG
jgi:hypothetical protein